MKQIKGTIITSIDQNTLQSIENGVIVIEGDRIIEVSPKILDGIEIIDYGDKLIMPCFIDTHLHAPQLNNLGLGIDKELIDWLQKYTFPEEKKFSDIQYAQKAYKRFINKLWEIGSYHAVIFSSIHTDSTIVLAKMLEEFKIESYVGKVNMDQNSPIDYIETTEQSLHETRRYIEGIKNHKYAKPIITPRFAPSCSKELLEGLGELANEYDLPIQSHLAENRKEIEWVKELFPEYENYTQVYRKTGNFRKHGKTIMAHGVWLEEEEKQILKEDQVFIAHAPYSNGDLASGIAPIKEYLERGIAVTLSSDISGGHVLFMGKIMQMAVILSNMYWVHCKNRYGRLCFEEVFYLATKGGGRFFSDKKLGSIEKGYQADFLVIDDSSLSDQNPRTPKERIERFIYAGDERNIEFRYLNGEIFEKPYPESTY